MKENDMRFQLDNFLLHPDNFITYNQKIDIYAEINKCVGYLSEILKNHPMDFYRYVSSLDSKYSEPDKKTHDTHSMKQVKHLINIVKFIPANKSIFEIPELFNKAISNNKRLGALLITKTGKKDSKPIGIITAWDLPLIDKYINKL